MPKKHRKRGKRKNKAIKQQSSDDKVAIKNTNKAIKTYTVTQNAITSEISYIFENLTNDTALVIIPPQYQHEHIQEIRVNDDKFYEKVLPHITILWPFVNPMYFAEIQKYLQHIIESNNIQSFRIQLSSFDIFDDVFNDDIRSDKKSKKRKKKEYAFLKPSKSSIDDLQNLFNAINTNNVFSDSLKYEQYNPHLTVGQYHKNEIKKKINKLNRKWETNKTEINFICDKIHILCRKKDDWNKMETQFVIHLKTNKTQKLIIGYIRNIENLYKLSNIINSECKELIINLYGS